MLVPIHPTVWLVTLMRQILMIRSVWRRQFGRAGHDETSEVASTHAAAGLERKMVRRYKGRSNSCTFDYQTRAKIILAVCKGIICSLQCDVARDPNLARRRGVANLRLG